MAQRSQQDLALKELQLNLQRMLEAEQRLSGEWLEGVSEMEDKVLTMKESVSVTVNQLRENLRLIGQYKVRMQTLHVRIAIESKVKDSFEQAKFQERHEILQQ